jgi:hypothetical protein
MGRIFLEAVRFRCLFLSPDKRQKTRLVKGWQDLQMTLMGRFCKFLKQNRELSYASVLGGKPVTSRYNWQMT